MQIMRHATVRLAAMPAIFLLACTPCDSVGCPSGFDLEIVAASGLSEGTFELTLEVESSEVAITCTIGDLMGPSACTIDEVTVFDVRAAAVEADGRMIITVNVVDTSESHDNFLAYRGPDAVAVSVMHEGQPVGSDSYQPTYDRTDHRGSPSCGYCDEHVEPERLDIVIGP
jgi:hypothetical protein